MSITKPTNEPSIFSVCWTKSSEVMKKKFFSFLEKKAMSDVTICAEGKFIYAHRLILASSSLYFEELFTSRPNNGDPVIHLDISYMNLCLIMKYAYSGEVLMAENRLQSFLEAAKSLKMFGLMENYESNKKLKKRIKKKKKRVESKKSNVNTKRLRADPDTFLSGVCELKRRKLNAPKELELSQTSTSKPPQAFRKRFAALSNDSPSPSKVSKKAKRSIESPQCRYCLKHLQPSSTVALNSHEMLCSALMKPNQCHNVDAF